MKKNPYMTILEDPKYQVDRNTLVDVQSGLFPANSKHPTFLQHLIIFVFLLVYLLVCLGLSVEAKVFPGQVLHYKKNSLIDNHDGTFSLKGYDTPELFDPNVSPRERQLGQRANAEAIKLMNKGKVRTITRGYDSNGRKIQDIYVDGRNLGDLLEQKGLASKKLNHNWDKTLNRF